LEPAGTQTDDAPIEPPARFFASGGGFTAETQRRREEKKKERRTQIPDVILITPMMQMLSIRPKGNIRDWR